MGKQEFKKRKLSKHSVFPRTPLILCSHRIQGGKSQGLYRLNEFLKYKIDNYQYSGRRIEKDSQTARDHTLGKIRN